MPILILLGIFGISSAINLHDTCTRNTHAYSKEELEDILRQVTGKSKKEARRIARNYGKR